MLFVCTTQGCVTEDEPQGPSISIGEYLPEFTIEMNTGDIVSTSSLKGKVPVIVFFNTDCSDCRKELPVIQKLWEKYRDDKDVEIVPISREESKKEIEKYWIENGFTMPFSPQDNREVYNLFAPSIIPRIYIADTNGIITAAFDDSDMPSLDYLISSIQTNL